MRRTAVCAAASLVWGDGVALIPLAGRACCCSFTKSQCSSKSLSLSLSRGRLSIGTAAMSFRSKASSASSLASVRNASFEKEEEEDEEGKSEVEDGFEEEEAEDEDEDEEEEFSSDDLDELEEEDSGDEFGDLEDGEQEFQLGDGEDGGGIVLGTTSWGAKALELAKHMLPPGGDFALYGFKACATGYIQIRLDKLSDQFGPTMEEVEKFNVDYTKLLEEAGRKGLVPSDVSIEVSSPGAERIVQVPAELERFKALPMQVQYYEQASGKAQEGIFELVSFDAESLTSVWKTADVRQNRGKGRGLNRKQRIWRLELDMSSIKMVRLYVDL